MRVMPYKIGSRSAKALAAALGCKRVRYDSTTFSNRYNHTIINWGYGGNIHFPHTRVINPTRAVETASNKLAAFRVMSANGMAGVIPEFTTYIHVAEEWDGLIVARFKLRGHSGDGIRIIGEDDSLYNYDPAPLYVRYIKKVDEYRFHVCDGSVIDVQQKRKRREVDNDSVDYQVRNLAGGWVYCRDDVHPHVSLATLACNACSVLGLDFGAVDIIWNKKQGKAYVLEVNTACGLEGSTVTLYANAIRRMS